MKINKINYQTMKIKKPYDFISKKISEIDSLTPKSNLLTIKDTVDH
jgi:hypothetical protein